MRTAVARCPQAVIVPPRFDLYRHVSGEVMEIFSGATHLVQPLSLDEAYLDVSEAAAEQDPKEIAIGLKAQVRQQLFLAVSVGIATSKSVAKIASDFDKPDGLVVVPPGTEREFLAPLPVRRLPGIGPKAEERLTQRGVHTIGDLAQSDASMLHALFGKRGPELRLLAQGRDTRPVEVERVAKSVSAENTFPTDLNDAETLSDEVRRLCQRVASRLQRSDLSGRTVTLKLRLADFTTLTRSSTFTIPIGDYDDLTTAALDLLRHEIQPGRSFRLLGVGVSNFPEARQLPLL
jgi:DNA polymerase-4